MTRSIHCLRAGRRPLPRSGDTVLRPLLCRRWRRFRPPNYHAYGVAAAQCSAFLSPDDSSHVDADAHAAPVADGTADAVADGGAAPGANGRAAPGSNGRAAFGADRRTDPGADRYANLGADRCANLGADGACFIQFAGGARALGVLMRRHGGCGRKGNHPRSCIGYEWGRELYRFNDQLWRISSRPRKRRSVSSAAVCFGNTVHGFEHAVS